MSPDSRSPDPVILSVHPTRRRARKLERQVQAWLQGGRASDPPDTIVPVPEWVRGARYQKAGRLQHAVMGTYLRGR